MKSTRAREPDPESQLDALERSVAGSAPLARLYVLVGEERYFRDRALATLVRAASAREMEVSRHDAHDPDFDPAGFAADVSAAPMFAPARFIVLKNAAMMLKKESSHDGGLADRALAFAKDASFPGALAIDADALRADHPLRAAASSIGVVVTSRRLYEDAPPWNPDPAKAELVQWCVAAAKRRGIPLDAHRAVALVAMTGNDLYALDANLERLKRATPREWKGLVPWTRGGAPHEVAEDICLGRAARALAGLEALYSSGFRERDGSKESDPTVVTTILLGALRSKARQALVGATSLETGADLAAAAEGAGVPANPKARAAFEARVRARSRGDWDRVYRAVQDLERGAKSGNSIDVNDWFALALRFRIADVRSRGAAPRAVER